MMESSSPMTPAGAVIAKHNALASLRQPWDSLWQELGDLVMPRKAYIQDFSATPNTSKESRLFDGTVAEANEDLAAGLMSWLTPADSPWQRMVVPKQFGNTDQFKGWANECTEAVAWLLADSNFYTEQHEMLLNRGGMGTGVLYGEDDDEFIINFDSWDVGSYSVCENHRGIIDTVSRERKMTARQIVQKFDTVPLKIVQQAADPEKCEEKHDVIHLIQPRSDKERGGKLGVLGMAFSSQWVLKEGAKMLRESGYEEFPAWVTRHLKWQSGPWGYCPAWRSLADSRQLQHLSKHLAVLAEVAAFPRMLIPTSHEGGINVSAYGRTYFGPDGEKPEEWLTGGRYDIGKDLKDGMQKAVRRAFGTDAFRMFSEADKVFTATQTLEMSSERLVQFSPTVTRLMREELTPALQWVFSTAARRSLPNWMAGRDGVLPLPPDELIAGGFLPLPEVEFSGRIAMAMKEQESAGIARTMELVLPLAQVKPEILDNYDFDEISRLLSRNNNVPEDTLVDMRLMAQVREAREQAQREQLLAEAVGQAA